MLCDVPHRLVSSNCMRIAGGTTTTAATVSTAAVASPAALRRNHAPPLPASPRSRRPSATNHSPSTTGIVQ